MNERYIEKKYPPFFTAVVKIFLILLIAAFVYNTAETAFDKNKTEAVSEAALSGGEIPESLSGNAVITAIKLLSGSLLIAFSYLSFLFFKGKEYIYFFITAAINAIFFISALSAFL